MTFETSMEQQTPTQPARRTPAGLLAFLVIGGISLLAVGIFVVAAFFSSGRGGGGPYVESPREWKRNQTVCLNNQRQLALALLMYAQDHSEVFPDASTVWSDISLSPGVLICPSSGGSLNSYGYHTDASSRSLGKITDPTSFVLTADSDSYSRLIATPAEVARTRHGGKGSILAFCDGHVEYRAATAPLALR